MNYARDYYFPCRYDITVTAVKQAMMVEHKLSSTLNGLATCWMPFYVLYKLNQFVMFVPKLIR